MSYLSPPPPIYVTLITGFVFYVCGILVGLWKDFLWSSKTGSRLSYVTVGTGFTVQLDDAQKAVI